MDRGSNLWKITLHGFETVTVDLTLILITLNLNFLARTTHNFVMVKYRRCAFYGTRPLNTTLSWGVERQMLISMPPHVQYHIQISP
jgi:hypothetical protein